MLLLATAFAGLSLAQTASADLARDEQTRLETCLERIESDPEAAYEDGLAWLGQGSRPPARQCVALALIGLGEAEAGAAELEDLANAPDAGSLEQRALYLAQSGNAWLAAGLPSAAATTLTNAVRLSPNDSELHADRAAAYLALERWEEALADLNNSLAIQPSNASARVLRARAYLEMERYNDALNDVDEARLQMPDDIDLLVLRGDIREARRVEGR